MSQEIDIKLCHKYKKQIYTRFCIRIVILNRSYLYIVRIVCITSLKPMAMQYTGYVIQKEIT